MPGQIHATASECRDGVRAGTVAFFGPHAGRRRRDLIFQAEVGDAPAPVAVAMGERQMLAVQATRISFNSMVLVVLPVEFLSNRRSFNHKDTKKMHKGINILCGLSDFVPLWLAFV